MADRPVLLTVGNHTQRSLWAPLSETYRLAFMDGGSQGEAAGAGVPDVLGLAAYADEAVISQARAVAMIRANDVLNAIADGLVVDPEVNDLHGAGLAAWAGPALYESWAATAGRISACSMLHQKEGVVGVLVHEDVTPMGRVAAQWGNAKGIPTLHLPHANHFSKAGTKDIHCSTTAQHLGVAGRYMRGWYSDCGVADDRMTTVGMPQWDKYMDQEQIPTKAFARHALGIKDGMYVLAYATTWYQMTTVWGNDPEAYLEECFSRILWTALELDAFLIVAMHPGETAGQEGHYAQRIKEAGLHGAVTRTHNAHTMRAADCVVTQGPSNVGVVAAMLDTPVVELYVPGARYPAYGPAGTWGDGLAQLIRDAVPNRHFADAMNDGLDGKATERAVEWVRSLCPV